MPDLAYDRVKNIKYTRDSETLGKHKITNQCWIDLIDLVQPCFDGKTWDWKFVKMYLNMHYKVFTIFFLQQWHFPNNLKVILFPV